MVIDYTNIILCQIIIFHLLRYKYLYAGSPANACSDTIAVISVDRVRKNKTYINKVDIYVESEGPVRARMKDNYNPP